MGRFATRALAALAFVLLTNCRSDSHRPNVVVIGVDTLRADHLGCYGYERPTSPRLDRFARESVRFTTAIAPAPWTLPAFASIFTGLLPSHHQAGIGSSDAGWTALGPDPATLATILRNAGYRTGGFVSNEFLAPATGLGRGFERYDPPAAIAPTVSAAIAWMQARAEEPFFLFLHIIDPHQPYAPPTEDALPFLDPTYVGPIGVSFDGFANPAWSAADRQRIVDLYDGEVHHADRLIGRVLDALAALGLMERTLVVITADHGEELFDHQALGHGHTLYDELLRVPLLIRFPGLEFAGTIVRQVRMLDVLPTLTDALGLKPPPALDGTTLLPLIRGETHSGPGPAYAEYVFWFDELKTVRRENEKLIVTPRTGHYRMFDLERDPHERYDVALAQPDRAAGLLADVDRLMLASLDGFHMLVRDVRESQHLHVLLETTGRFEGIETIGMDPRNRAATRHEISADGRTLTLDVEGIGGANGIRGFRFDTNGETVTVRSVTLSDGRVTRDHIVLPSAQGIPEAAPLTLAAGTDAPAVRYPMIPAAAADGAPVVAFELVRRARPSFTGIEPRQRDALRALGYVP